LKGEIKINQFNRMPKKLKKATMKLEKTIHSKLELNGKIENKLKFYKKIKN